MQLPEITTDQAARLMPLVAKYVRDLKRQRALRELIRGVVREELAMLRSPDCAQRETRGNRNV